MTGEAALVVTYPEPVGIGGQAYRYLVLYADRDHILPIAATLAFLPP
jgi:TolB protein